MNYKITNWIGASVLGGSALLLANPATAGNFIGDSRDDLVVGAVGKAPTSNRRSGAAMLYRGARTGVVPTDVIDQGGLGANEVGDEFGAAFAIGDFDGDGQDDIAIGAPGEAPGDDPRSGAVFVYLGTSTGLQPDMVLTQRTMGVNESGDRFGASLVAADFNGDGIDDLVVGAPTEAIGPNPASGAAFLFLGTQSGLMPNRVIDQGGLGNNEIGDMFGHVLSAGDYNGDGRADLAVGAPGEAPGSDPKSGVVFVFRGTNAGLAPERVIDQMGLGANESGDLFGWSLASGDLNGDGRDDLAVGAPGEAPGADPKSGGVFIYRGSVVGLTPRQFVDQTGLGANENGDEFGLALSSGDYNGDGRDDLAVGAPGEAPGSDPRSGGVFIYRATTAALMPSQFISQEGLGANESGDRFGEALSSGNYISNSRIDLAIGAPGERPGPDPKSGGVFLMRGTADILRPHEFIDQSGLIGNEAGDLFGLTMAE